MVILSANLNERVVEVDCWSKLITRMTGILSSQINTVNVYHSGHGVSTSLRNRCQPQNSRTTMNKYKVYFCLWHTNWQDVHHNLKKTLPNCILGIQSSPIWNNNFISKRFLGKVMEIAKLSRKIAKALPQDKRCKCRYDVGF